MSLLRFFSSAFSNSDRALCVFRDSHHISFVACVRLRSVLLIIVFACSLHLFHVESLAPCSRSVCPSLPGCRSTTASICISIFVTTSVLKASPFFTMVFICRTIVRLSAFGQGSASGQRFVPPSHMGPHIVKHYTYLQLFPVFQSASNLSNHKRNESAACPCMC